MSRDHYTTGKIRFTPSISDDDVQRIEAFLAIDQVLADTQGLVVDNNGFSFDNETSTSVVRSAAFPETLGPAIAAIIEEILTPAGHVCDGHFETTWEGYNFSQQIHVVEMESGSVLQGNPEKLDGMKKVLPAVYVQDREVEYSVDL